jgi:pimeloyl-ACP methyl ester carboxylesterase
MSQGEQAGRHVEAAGTSLFVRRWGTGERAVVCWHALGVLRTGCVMEEVGPALADRLKASVFALDAPGFGRSRPTLDPAGYRPSALAALAESAMDGLGVDKALWLGQSWGATVGCHLAARSPQRLSGLVLLDAGYQEAPAPADGLDAVITGARADWETFRFESWEALEAAARAGARRWNEQTAAAVRDAVVSTSDGLRPIVQPEVLAASAWGVATEPPRLVWGDLSRSGIPVLLLAAEEPADDEERARQIAAFRAAVPTAVVTTVKAAGHDVLGDAGPPLLDIITEWFAAQSPPRSP